MAFQLTARMEGGHQSSVPRAEALGGGCSAGVIASRVKKKTWGGISPGRISTESGGRGKKGEVCGEAPAARLGPQSLSQKMQGFSFKGSSLH